jgi:hypothetical protein
VADKYLMRELLDKLLNELNALEHDVGVAPVPAMQARYEVFHAEASHILGMVLPADSPLRALLEKYRTTPLLPTLALPPPNTPDPLVVLRGIIDAARRLNETRGNEESNPTLVEDVERILHRKFSTRPIVLIPAGLLLAAFGFFVFGDIRFQDMRINALDDINKKASAANTDIQRSRDDGIKTIENLQAPVKKATSDVAQLNKDIATARQNVTDLTASNVRNLTAEQTTTINNATTAATKSIAIAESQASNVIAATRDAQKQVIEQAGTDARKLISDQADKLVQTTKEQVAPTFAKAIAKAASDVDEINQKLPAIQSNTHALNAALREATDPTHAWTHRLAAYFDQTVITVYAILAILVILTVVNVLFVVLRWRKQGAQ